MSKETNNRDNKIDYFKNTILEIERDKDKLGDLYDGFHKVLEDKISKAVVPTSLLKDNILVNADELDISKEAPYMHDLLSRKADGDKLVGIVNGLKSGAVIALDGEWGTGKTTFVKMWMNQLKNNGFPILYYNAWENDINDEPLFSMLRQLNSLNKEDGLDEVFRIGAKVLVGGLMGGLVEINPAAKFVKGFIKGGAKQIENSIYDSLKESDSRSGMINNFKEALTSYVEKVCGLEETEEETTDFKPLVYIIDDLDRCNPTFAVKVLERMKHLFAVPNVVFVLAVDKQQMAYSINGYYGSDKFDSMEYLRKFIDIDYKLPKSNNLGYIFSLISPEVLLKKEKMDETASVVLNLLHISEYNNLSLRQIQRVFLLMRIVYPEANALKDFDNSVFVFMAYLKVCKPYLYEKVKEQNFTVQEFYSELESLIISMKNRFLIDDNTHTYYCTILLQVLWAYYQYLKKSTIIKPENDLFNEDGSLQLTVKKFDCDVIKKRLLQMKQEDKSFGDLYILLNELDMLAHTKERGYKDIENTPSENHKDDASFEI